MSLVHCIVFTPLAPWREPSCTQGEQRDGSGKCCRQSVDNLAEPRSPNSRSACFLVILLMAFSLENRSDDRILHLTLEAPCFLKRQRHNCDCVAAGQSVVA